MDSFKWNKFELSAEDVLKKFFCVLLCSVMYLGLPVSAAESAYDAGLKAYKAGDFARASVSFEEALKSNQKDPLLWYYDALSFHQMKNWPLARSRYKTLATYFPQTAPGKAAIGVLKTLDPSFVQSGQTAAKTAEAGSASGTAAASSAVKTSAAAAAGGEEGDSDEEKTRKAKEAVELAQELATLPDTAHFYFKKGPQGHMEVDLMMNGHPVKAEFDTGASAFFYADQLRDAGLDLNKAQAGMGTRGWAGVAVETKVIPVEVKLGTLTRKINISMQENSSGLAKNLIGQTFIKGYQYEIDDKGGRVDLHKNIDLKASDINPLYDIPLTVRGKDDFIPVTINAKKSEAFIDTGASNTIFSAAEAERLGIQSSGERVRLTGVGGSLTTYRAYVDIRIGGMQRLGFPVLIGGSCGCALGQDLMDGWRYKVDREHKLLRFYH